jgi:hypothetical protein
MDPQSGLCEGCLRTIDEITGWAAATDERKAHILAAVAQRRARLDAAPESLRGDCDR